MDFKRTFATFSLVLEALTLMVTAMAHYKFFMYDQMLSEANRAMEIAEELLRMRIKAITVVIMMIAIL